MTAPQPVTTVVPDVRNVPLEELARTEGKALRPTARDGRRAEVPVAAFNSTL